MLHVDLPTRSEILNLASARTQPSATIYLATTPLTEAAQADRTELKNLGREAVAQLEAAGTDKRSIWPIEAALDEIAATTASGHIRPTALRFSSRRTAFGPFACPRG